MDDSYYKNTRTDLADALPDARGLRVLELGCGQGYTGAWLKEIGLASRVVGMELFEEAGAQARARLDAVHVGDLDQLAPPEEQFDLILCADVIEHLRDPWGVMARYREVLAPGGWLVTSTPNMRYWRVLYDLGVKGRFEYADEGIYDRTHLRWFTRRSIVALHEGLNLRVEHVGYPELSGKRATLDRLTRSRLRDLLGGQHVVRSRAVR